MPEVRAEHIINAPVSFVFDVIAHVENFQKAVRHIINIEYLTDQRKGVGTRFRETRLMKKREMSTTIEVAQYKLNESVRMISDEGGTIWDSLFETHPEGNSTRLTLVMEARPHKFLAKIVTPLIIGMVSKAVESDMLAIKAYCEANSRAE